MEDKVINIEINKIIRSNRKTISLQITEDAALIIRAPYNADQETISKVIMKHKKWIEKKKADIKRRNVKISSKEFVNGEGFLYLGKSYKLRIVENQEIPLKFENEFYLARNALAEAKDIFIDWYKKMAYEKISERVIKYANEGGYKFNKIRITDAQKKWGACSYNGNLSFSWRLIMAPLPVIDYVVIHELVHLEEKKHTKTFWNKVKMLTPKFDECQKWLNENGYLFKLL